MRLKMDIVDKDGYVYGHQGDEVEVIGPFEDKYCEFDTEIKHLRSGVVFLVNKALELEE